jgi:arsenite methyltransferase
MRDQDIRETVKEKYGQIASQVGSGRAACCGSAPAEGKGDPITSNLYTADETEGLPAEAMLASLGCGNPTALARLNPGETVLDLGSGGGIDVLLSAKRVGPTGKAYGLDMTDEMLALARENQCKAGVENVEFLKGEIEQIPLPDNSVDVIISNCVINLSADKERVLSEAFRVLKPGGRFAVSDVVVRGEVPAPIRRSVELWIGCVAGALEESEYRAKLAGAGFEAITLEPTRIYRIEDAREFLSGSGIDVDAVAPSVDGKFMSAFVRAQKPSLHDNETEITRSRNQQERRPSMVQNTFHVAISVKDLPTAIEHYKKILGLEPAKVKPDYAKFEITDPPVILSLNLGGEPGTVSHLGIRYLDTGEVATELARTKAQDKFWVHDADGLEWEMYTLLEDAEVHSIVPTPAEACCSPKTTKESTTRPKTAASGCCSPTAGTRDDSQLVQIQAKSSC